ncbi:uncharacterized protein LOC62_01G001480 [Vanrija pseudolonga]|uniref:Uncharacterized protein n=1 Tax=Vanrija pseudolonga TaxID=143232 RepID=A0AAF0Y591_9TREE|nr:hypothetical protein LOC62_01G001480 [Vanrija pseudolonga]
MFQSEEGVQLSAISGSPSDSLDEQRRHADANRLSDISTNSSQDSPASPTEVFGSTFEKQSSRAFSLKARPLSEASTASDDVDGANDTLDEIRVSTPSKVGYYAGTGEGTPTLHSTTNNEGRLMLSGTHGRPSKPRGSRRHSRSTTSDLRQSRDSTPSLGCSSASGSDSMSIYSLRSNASNPPEVVAGVSTYQQTSMFISLKHEPTIREVSSLATVRPTSPRLHFTDDENPWDVEDINETRARSSLIAVHREAEYEIQVNKSQWADSELSEAPRGHDHAKLTKAEVLALIIKSQADYRNLEELPLGRAVRRRRTSSMEARATSGPYNNNNPIPPPVTRFQNKKGSSGSAISATTTTTSSYGGFRDEDFDVVPVSPLITEFARQPLPFTKAPGESSNTLRVPEDPSNTLQVPSSSSSRMRVNSTQRRENVGWGRRRHSDGPEQLLIPSAADLVVQPKSASAATFPTHRIAPSFIAFSPLPADIRRRNEESLKAAATSERALPTVRMPPPRPPRQRDVALHVNSSGSPVNLHSLENGPAQALHIPKRNQQSSGKENSPRKVLASSNPNVLSTRTSRGALQSKGKGNGYPHKEGGIPAPPIWNQPLPALPSPSRDRRHSRAKDSMHLRQPSRHPAAPLRV